MIRIENYSFRHYHECKVTLPGEEFYKEFFDDFDKNNANDSCHTVYIKYLPSYVADCSILSNLKTNFKINEKLKELNNLSELRYNEEEMIASLTRQLQYLIQTQQKRILYETDLEDIPRFRESLQIIENEKYLEDIHKNQIVEVNIISEENVKENIKKWI